MACRIITMILALGLMFALSMPSWSAELSEEELERWLEGDDPLPYEEKGGGEQLQFLTAAPDEPVPHSNTVLKIGKESAKSGWVKVEQCHHDIDPVPVAEVVYQFEKMRGLHVLSASGIEKAWVDGQSVQLRGVGHEALLCLSLEAQLLRHHADGDRVVRYGPFQRRFFDSYFPMQVTLEVDFHQAGLSYQGVVPQPQEGFKVEVDKGRVVINALFKGKLTLELYFVDKAHGG